MQFIIAEKMKMMRSEILNRMTMDAESSPETPANFYRIAQCYNSEGTHLHI